MAFGERLQEVRRRAGLTQEQVCRGAERIPAGRQQMGILPGLSGD